jgi:pimeloyl-ACP methyl ester carboxylesterase
MSTHSATTQNLTTGNLSVPGASIYYETYGSGPLLLCISGANGNADIWQFIAQHLSSSYNYTVAIYDRRGFSRSYLTPTLPQDYSRRLQTDADDVHLLIEHLSPNDPATVLGTSSGAIVALQLLLMYPTNLRTLIAHEPPALRLLPNYEALKAAQHDVYDTYRASGIPPAMLKFAANQHMNPHELPLSIDTSTSPYLSGNLQYWFEREFLHYPFHSFDVAEFEQLKDKLVLANGKATDPLGSHYQTNPLLGDKLNLDLVYLAGDHFGYAGRTMREFAADLMGVLEKRSNQDAHGDGANITRTDVVRLST